MSVAPATPQHVIGLGNRWRGDDAVGVLLVEDLARRAVPGLVCRLWEDADALTVAHELLALAGPVVLVDAADLAAPPATACWLDGAAVRLRDPAGSASTHGLRLATALEIVRGLGWDHPLRLFLVQPARCDGAGLSAELADRRAALLDQLAAGLGAHGVA